MMPAVTDAEFATLVARCKTLPFAKREDPVDDYIENLLLTVLDFQMRATNAERAAHYYNTERRHDIRTHQNLRNLLAGHPDTEEGNLKIARYLWGYNLWTRVELLRRFVDYFESSGVTSQEDLREWAGRTDFEQFEGRVKGAGIAIFQLLRMRLGADTIKPDVHIHRFLRDSLGRPVSDPEAVNLLVRAAGELGLPARDLDSRIWEYQRGL